MASNCSMIRVVRRLGSTCFIAFCMLLLPSASAVGQVDQGSITGVVQDATGAVVPEAQVTLLNTDQGISLETRSSGSGNYTFSPVRIGHYTITVIAPGFEKTTQQNLSVAVGQELQVNVAMQTGSTSETVTISTAPPQLQTDESSVGQVVDEHTVVSLPLNGRNFTFLAQLAAGVNTLPGRYPRQRSLRRLYWQTASSPPRTITCSTVSTTTPTPLTSLMALTMSFCLPSTPFRSSRCRQRTSAPNSVAPLAPFSMPPSSPVQTRSTVPFGSSSATTSLTLPTGSKITATSRKASSARTSSVPPSAVRS